MALCICCIMPWKPPPPKFLGSFIVRLGYTLAGGTQRTRPKDQPRLPVRLVGDALVVAFRRLLVDDPARGRVALDRVAVRRLVLRPIPSPNPFGSPRPCSSPWACRRGFGVESSLFRFQTAKSGLPARENGPEVGDLVAGVRGTIALKIGVEFGENLLVRGEGDGGRGIAVRSAKAVEAEAFAQRAEGHEAQGTARPEPRAGAGPRERREGGQSLPRGGDPDLGGVALDPVEDAGVGEGDERVLEREPRRRVEPVEKLQRPRQGRLAGEAGRRPRGRRRGRCRRRTSRGRDARTPPPRGRALRRRPRRPSRRCAGSENGLRGSRRGRRGGRRVRAAGTRPASPAPGSGG